MSAVEYGKVSMRPASMRPRVKPSLAPRLARLAVAVLLIPTLATGHAAEGDGGQPTFETADGSIRIVVPDDSWSFTTESLDAPHVAALASPDSAAKVSIQVQLVPGQSLETLMPMIENSLQMQSPDFQKLSTGNRQVSGHPAIELVCTMTQAGAPLKARLVLLKPADRLYVIGCKTAPDVHARFEKDFDVIADGFQLVAQTSTSKPAPVKAAIGDPRKVPAIQAFFGPSGPGSQHPEAPRETGQFGQLAGLWRADQQMMRQDGTWMSVSKGYWAWKFILDGFATQDLWYQDAGNLPPYMASFGRDYHLTGVRMFNVKEKRWNITWLANSAGTTPAADSGTFTATFEDGSIVMVSPPSDVAGLQRIVFSEIQEDSFVWTSDYSNDSGQTWTSAMRVLATRVPVAG